jgi:hypothetical protein
VLGSGEPFVIHAPQAWARIEVLERIPICWTHFRDSQPLIDVIQAFGWMRRPAVNAASLFERPAPENRRDGGIRHVVPTGSRAVQGERQLRHQTAAAGAGDR